MLLYRCKEGVQRYKITLLQTGNDSGEQNNKNRKILLKSHM